MRASKKPRNVKEKKLDELFSKLIRGRAGYKCEAKIKCNGRDGQMQCSHFFGRRLRSVRFAADNAACHCASCHRWLEEHPIEFADWINNHLGEEATDALRRRAHTPLKRSQADMRDLHDKMKSELARMESLRAQGETGRIEFKL